MGVGVGDGVALKRGTPAQPRPIIARSHSATKPDPMVQGEVLRGFVTGGISMGASMG